MREKTSLVTLNRGLVSRLGLARMDVKRLALAAATMINWIPRVLGPMSLRPGWRYILTTLFSQQTRYLRFIFATYDTALLELTPLALRVIIGDVLLTRPAVTSVVANGTFTFDLSSWTNNDEVGGASTWTSPGYMQLLGNGIARAIRDQQVTNLTPSTEHALRIVIARGPVTLRVGTAVGTDDLVRETTLGTGTHSIAFVPAGNFWIRFASAQVPVVWVAQCTVEAAGVVSLPTPWNTGDLQNVRYDQSADVVFLACSGLQQRRIERRGDHPGGRSWSVVIYAPTNGPFQVQNVTGITFTPSAISGNVTVTASQPYFRSTHKNSLFSLTSVGQVVTNTAGAAGVATPAIRVIGVTDSRVFSYEVSGFGTATVDVQRSYDGLTNWVNIGGGFSFGATASGTVNDLLNNQIVYYRLNCSAWTSGAIVMTLRYSGGSIRGVFRVTDYSSPTSVSAEVVVALGGTTPSTTWQEGQWSDKRGWPSSLRLHEGRLWWAGINGIWGSVSDAYDSFDETVVGDSGPINRTVGAGPVDTINWLLSMRGLLMGAQGAEMTARSSSLDEPLTPTNFNLKTPSTQGSAAVEAVKVDQMGYFVNRSAMKVFELAFDVKAYDYGADDMMAIVPELGYPGIVRIDVQRQPDTRLHCVRADGVVAILVLDKVEDVLAWTTVNTVGFVEDVVILPALAGTIDDQVYYVVRRTINNATVRYLEKWAQEIDCRGDKQLCNLGDAFTSYTGVPTTVVAAPQLAGQAVTVWADGFDVGTDDTVRPWVQRFAADTAGNITLSVPAANVVVGLPYQAPFKSVKLGQQSQEGSPLNKQKKVGGIGLILADTHPKGLRFGDTLDETGSHRMDDMPSIEEGAPVGPGMHVAYDENLIPFPGTWTTDARICLMAQAPRPATVLAITPDLEQH